MNKIKCHRCGTCCRSFLATIPKYETSDLSPGFLRGLREEFGEEYAAEYWRKNSEKQEKRCKWLRDEADGTTSCAAYARRSAECADFPEYKYHRECRIRKAGV